MGLLRATTSFHVQLAPPEGEGDAEIAEVSVFVEKGSVLDESDPIVAAAPAGYLNNVEAQAPQVSAHGPANRVPAGRRGARGSK